MATAPKSLRAYKRREQAAGQDGRAQHGERDADESLPAGPAQDPGRLLQRRVHVPQGGADGQQDVGEADDNQRESGAGKPVDAGMRSIVMANGSKAASSQPCRMPRGPRPTAMAKPTMYDGRRQRQHGGNPPKPAGGQVGAHGEPGQRGGDGDATDHHGGHQRHGAGDHFQRPRAEDEIDGLRAGAQGSQGEIDRGGKQERGDQQGRNPHHGGRAGGSLEQPTPRRARQRATQIR